MKLTWDEVLPIWWSYLWRAVVFGMLGGAAAGFVAGLLGVVLKIPPASGQYIGAAAGFAAGIAATLPAMKAALEKHVVNIRAAVESRQAW